LSRATIGDGRIRHHKPLEYDTIRYPTVTLSDFAKIPQTSPFRKALKPIISLCLSMPARVLERLFHSQRPEIALRKNCGAKAEKIRATLERVPQAAGTCARREGRRHNLPKGRSRDMRSPPARPEERAYAPPLVRTPVSLQRHDVGRAEPTMLATPQRSG
jgi:hypothetical protein